MTERTGARRRRIGMVAITDADNDQQEVAADMAYRHALNLRRAYATTHFAIAEGI